MTTVQQQKYSRKALYNKLGYTGFPNKSKYTKQTEYDVQENLLSNYTDSNQFKKTFEDLLKNEACSADGAAENTIIKLQNSSKNFLRDIFIVPQTWEGVNKKTGRPVEVKSHSLLVSKFKLPQETKSSTIKRFKLKYNDDFNKQNLKFGPFSDKQLDMMLRIKDFPHEVIQVYILFDDTIKQKQGFPAPVLAIQAFHVYRNAPGSRLGWKGTCRLRHPKGLF